MLSTTHKDTRIGTHGISAAQCLGAAYPAAQAGQYNYVSKRTSLSVLRLWSSSQKKQPVPSLKLPGSADLTLNPK